MLRIYVASSWRNQDQPHAVRALMDAGHDVYDFRNPMPGCHGFHWSEIDPGWMNWTPEAFARAIDHPIARRGFDTDMQALRDCDVCVLLMPCGRSAHLEGGWAAGAGKRLITLLSEDEPELMYRMGDVCTCLGDVISLLEGA